MKSPKDFLNDLEQYVESLYKVSEEMTQMYFESNPTKEMLLEHFKLRMMNERWNMVEFAKKVAELPIDTPAEEAMLLCKQTYDEANHYRLVKEVIEHINNGPIVMEEVNQVHGKKDREKGVSVIDKYEAQNDPLVMALYQLIGEGRAARVWSMIEQCAGDQEIANRYGKIARDEKFHSNIGRWKLSQLCDTQEAQDRVMDLARQMCWDLYEVCCLNTCSPTDAHKALMRETFGEPTKELVPSI